jgi:DNA repair protein RecN (Recombination protein N)
VIASGSGEAQPLIPKNRRLIAGGFFVPVGPVLQSLRIRNLALLEEVSLEFNEGFTAVTGETGAGKSILLGALSLLAGERADKTIIRQGAPAAEVEAALFFRDPARLDRALEELGLPVCEEGVLILRRILPREKAPRISVNGALATLAALQRLGELWIDFHGPAEPRRLLRPDCQLELLDLHGKAGAQLADYAASFRAWREAQAEHRRVATEQRLAPDQIDFLRAQLARFDTVELNGEAIEGLERDHQRLSRSRELQELSGGLEAGLTGDDGLQPRLAALLREARTLESLDPASRALVERLASLAVELNDLGAEFGALSRELHLDPAQAEALNTRMDAWLELRRRHGGELASVITAREEMRRRLEIQGDLDGTLARLEEAAEAALAEVRRKAKTLRAAREKAANSLEKAAAAAISRLGFARADLRIRVTPLPEPGPSGDCSVEFLFSPNAGEAPLPLARIASSGELARVMLALKTVLASLDAVPLLVFDEVDANVGGEIGRVVGSNLAEIAAGHQVLCVTHLPQVAAQASSHLVVRKDQSGERAVVGIAPLHDDRKARIAELARMLGDSKSRSALEHAAGLLGGTRHGGS